MCSPFMHFWKAFYQHLGIQLPLISLSRCFDYWDGGTKRHTFRQTAMKLSNKEKKLEAAEAWNVIKTWNPPSSHTRWFQQHLKVQIHLIWASLVAFSPFPSLLKSFRPQAGPCCRLLETFVKPVVTAAPFNCFNLFSGGTLIFTSDLCAADFPFMSN